MRSKFYLFIVAAALLLSSCGKDPIPPKDLYFSILGDSYSTFEGYVDPETNDVWSYYEQIGVTEVEQLWWHQVAQTMNWHLDKNNSFSGSLICNLNYAHYYGSHSFLKRMDDLGNPDVILVFGGTNDIWDEAPMGEFKYEDWTEQELCTFRPALAALFSGLQRLYPEAKIWFMADEALGNEFMESVHTIARYYHVSCIDLHDIHKDWMHPDVQGMADIATQVVAAIQKSV